jgi:predicted transglutaminase-like cysteine proteinase
MDGSLPTTHGMNSRQIADWLWLAADRSWSTQVNPWEADVWVMPRNAVSDERRLDRVLSGLWSLALLLFLALSQTNLFAWDANRLVSVAAQRSAAALAGARALQAALAGMAGQSEGFQVVAINGFVNRRIEYREDIDVWGQIDYWASPLETLEKGQGDCEDFAIAKYFSLTALGVPHRKLRLVYVRAAMGGPPVPHMVLAYYSTPDADPLVLDDLIPEVKPASQRPDLTPVFSFNAEGIWEGVSLSTVRGNPADRLSRWGDVMRKAREEGF